MTSSSVTALSSELSCLNGHKTRVTQCRCWRHWTGERCDVMDCGAGKLSPDGSQCRCPAHLVGKYCHFEICRLRRSNVTYCYPVDRGATPLFNRCTVENRIYTSNADDAAANFEDAAGTTNVRRLELCPCFRGTVRAHGYGNQPCRCVDDYRGELCELKPGDAPERLHFDTKGEMTKNTTAPTGGGSGFENAQGYGSVVVSPQWASPFTLFTIFILLAVILVACFRQRHAGRWRVDSLRLQALQVTLFRRATNGNVADLSNNYFQNARRFRMIFDGAPIYFADGSTSVNNGQLEPMLSTIMPPRPNYSRENLPITAPSVDRPPPYEEVMNSPPPPYKLPDDSSAPATTTTTAAATTTSSATT